MELLKLISLPASILLAMIIHYFALPAAAPVLVRASISRSSKPVGSR